MTDEFKIKYKRPISNMYNCKKCCYLGVCSDAQVTYYLQIRKKNLICRPCSKHFFLADAPGTCMWYKTKAITGIIGLQVLSQKVLHVRIFAGQRPWAPLLKGHERHCLKVVSATAYMPFKFKGHESQIYNRPAQQLRKDVVWFSGRE